MKSIGGHPLGVQGTGGLVASVGKHRGQVMSREGCEKPKGPESQAVTMWRMPRENCCEGGNGHPSPCCEQISQGRPGKCELYLTAPFESDSREELEQERVC